MFPFLIPLIFISIIIFAISYLLFIHIYPCNQKKTSDIIYYSYPSRTYQRDYHPSPTKPCINYVKRTHTHRKYFSDSDFQSDSSDFSYEKPSHLTSNIGSQKGGFKYDIKNEQSEKKELSPVLPT